ncbi:hypothetical protein J7T55_014435 [Diaporthe amygdali]|uniref:uncharacterized protein n=1 Tax=Phomopsis amygdali TaxID=1214568 RepID=UPI0022FF3D08|nr:uncharacterized protein J7T55_014435 [Diaporthe amygdali]KAJ0117984.1 hypothetical protein J7T55_014435 [Diaporthe amygdali]
MASHARHDLNSNPSRKEIYVKLWEPHRCNGSGPICRWKLVDEGFLEGFAAQFEKVRRRIACSEEDVLEAITSIKKATADERKNALTDLKVTSSVLVIPPEKERPFQLAASVATMCNCIGQDWGDSRYGDSALGSLSRWQCDESLDAFIKDSFPKEYHKELQSGGRKGEAIRRKLTAVNLKAIGGLEIQGTHDLRNHLRLNDWEGKVRVKVFHHTSFLRQHLLASKQTQEQGDPDEVCNGFILPRELALETLYTLQILFPHDDQTNRLIATLVSKEGFDPNVSKHITNGTDDNGIELKGEQKEAQKWEYWGSRLLDLYEELENERPHGAWDIWVERNSKNRHDISMPCCAWFRDSEFNLVKTSSGRNAATDAELVSIQLNQIA